MAVEYRTITDPKAVDINLAAEMRGLAHTAWRAALDDSRSAQEIDRYFPLGLEAQLQFVQQLRTITRRSGAVAIAQDEASAQLVGYALARPDVSPLGGRLPARFIRARKQLSAMSRPNQPGKVYALLQHVAVAPEHWGERIGPRLAREALSAAGFRANQPTTAYAFAENGFALRALQRWGYRYTPSFEDQQRALQPNYHYFGSEYDPVEQYRFAQPSLAVALDNLSRRISDNQ